MTSFFETDPLGGQLKPLVDLAAAENKTGGIAWSRVYNEFIAGLEKARATYSDAALAYGLEAATRASAPSINYVKKAAKKHGGQAEGNRNPDNLQMYQGGQNGEGNQGDSQASKRRYDYFSVTNDITGTVWHRYPDPATGKERWWEQRAYRDADGELKLETWEETQAREAADGA